MEMPAAAVAAVVPAPLLAATAALLAISREPLGKLVVVPVPAAVAAEAGPASPKTVVPAMPPY
jgi:hypothetical protein